MVDYVNNKNNGEFMDASDLEAIETASASKQDKDIGTNNRAIVSGATGELEASATTKTEIGHVSGVTSSIQAQINTNATAINTNATAINTKQATITGAATTIDDVDLAASMALASDVSGKVAVSATTTAELEILSGATLSTAEANLLTGETALHPTGTESAQGELQQSTLAATITGTATDTATHPAGVKAAIDAAGVVKVVLPTPVSIPGTLSAGAWTTINDSTIAAAAPTSATIKIYVLVTESSVTNLNFTVFLRETGSGLGSTFLTAKGIFHEQSSSAATLTCSGIVIADVTLDGGYDFDYYILVSGSGVITASDMVLIGYNK